MEEKTEHTVLIMKGIGRNGHTINSQVAKYFLYINKQDIRSIYRGEAE